MHILIKRIYLPYSEADGFRVLVDRLWPRGVSKAKARIDWWCKELTPSTALRQWYHQDKVGRWDAFQARYQAELDQAEEAASDFFKKTRGQDPVTLLYGAKDPEHNHALVLQRFLKSAQAHRGG